MKKPTMFLCPCDSPGKNTEVVALPPPGDLPDSGIKPTSLVSLALAGRFLTTSATWEAAYCLLPAPKWLVPLPLKMRLLSVSRVPSALWKDMWMLGTRSVPTAEVRVGGWLILFPIPSILIKLWNIPSLLCVSFIYPFPAVSCRGKNKCLGVKWPGVCLSISSFPSCVTLSESFSSLNPLSPSCKRDVQLSAL